MFETSSESSDGGRRPWDDDNLVQLDPDVAEEGVTPLDGTPNTTVQPFNGVLNNGAQRGFTPRNSDRVNLYSAPKPTAVGGSENLRFNTIAGVPNVTSHAPSGIGWITPAAWASATWDGTPYNPVGKTRAQICSWVFPTANTMRGLRQLFESQTWFANPAQPTSFEIDLWNLAVVNHFRNLFGIPPIEASLRLYQEAQWSTERRWSNIWSPPYTNNYPANGQSAYGPCPNGNPHCGATFLPNLADQLNNSQQYGWLAQTPSVLSTSMVRQSVAEALGGTNTNIPWSIKLARVIAVFLCNEGLTGHTGPFLRRQKIGMIWHDLGDGTTQVRFKFGGAYTPFAGE